jgi:hypothetical protein
LIAATGKPLVLAAENHMANDIVMDAAKELRDDEMPATTSASRQGSSPGNWMGDQRHADPFIC